MKYLLIVLLVLATAFRASNPERQHACAVAATTTDDEQRPKNIILMIGDGMGLTQITAAMYSNNGQPLHLEKCTNTGLIKTHAANKLITDSAAGATAFSCGCKTNNGTIGMTPRNQPCKTILEEAASAGLATGLVVTSSITHATPAAFVAHARSRTHMEDIARGFLQNQVDFLIGGGMKNFHQRTDGEDLLMALKAKNYVIQSWQTHRCTDLLPDPARPFAWFAHPEHPESYQKGRDWLPHAARLAVDFLKKRSDKGFFLMIEGSQIDWGGHAKNAAYTIAETLDFDRAIGEVLQFAEADGQTLVIVTADHETGGMSILNGSKENQLEIAFSTEHHTATLVPVFAFGPGANRFNGVYDNTDIYWKMRELFGFEQTTPTVSR